MQEVFPWVMSIFLPIIIKPFFIQVSQIITKRYHVYCLVYYEIVSNIKDAIHREKSIKGFSRNKKEVLINSINPEWKDLSKEWL